MPNGNKQRRQWEGSTNSGPTRGEQNIPGFVYGEDGEPGVKKKYKRIIH